MYTKNDFDHFVNSFGEDNKSILEILKNSMDDGGNGKLYSHLIV